MQIGVVVAVCGALAAKACHARAVNEPYKDDVQISLEDPSREEDVVLLNVDTDDRLDYKITNDDGSYQYGYQTGPLHGGGHSFRHEYRRPDGVLFGQHGHETASGVLTSTNYVADARGYRVLQEGQEYEPVSKNQLVSRRSGTDGHRHSQRFQLKPRDLVKMSDVERIEMDSDADAVLAADEIPPRWFLDPDTGAYRFLYRSVSDPDTVAFRSETRRKDGVIFGQFGHRSGQTQPASLVSFVSDALGYRVVDPARGPVPILSESSALRLQREGRKTARNDLTPTHRSKLSDKRYRLRKYRDENIKEVNYNIEEESSGFLPDYSTDSKLLDIHKNDILKVDQEEGVSAGSYAFDISHNTESESRQNEIEKRLDSNIRVFAIKNKNEKFDNDDDQSTPVDEENKSKNEKDAPKDERDAPEDEEDTQEDEVDATNDVNEEDTEDDKTNRPEDDQHFEDDNSLSPIVDESGELDDLNSVVVEAASSSPQSSPPESSAAEFEPVSTTPVLQLLARYPPVVMTPAEALQHPEKIPSLIPYGAMKQLISDTYVASDSVGSEVGSRSSSPTLSPEGHAIVKYQSLPYALVPLSLLPIRTYKVVKPASGLPPSVHIRSY